MPKGNPDHQEQEDMERAYEEAKKRYKQVLEQLVKQALKAQQLVVPK